MFGLILYFLTGILVVGTGGVICPPKNKRELIECLISVVFWPLWLLVLGCAFVWSIVTSEKTIVMLLVLAWFALFFLMLWRA